MSGHRWLLLGSLLILLTGVGCADGTIPSVQKAREYVVEFALATGETISETAGSLADALVAAWRRVFPEWEGNIRIDPDDPLRGVLQGEYRYKVVTIEADGRRLEIDFTFHDPKMSRSTRDAEWNLDPSNYKGLVVPQQEASQ